MDQSLSPATFPNVQDSEIDSTDIQPTKIVDDNNHYDNSIPPPSVDQNQIPIINKMQSINNIKDGPTNLSVTSNFSDSSEKSTTKRILNPNLLTGNSQSTTIQRMIPKKKRQAASSLSPIPSSVLTGPFKIPSDNEIFAYRSQQRQERFEYQQSLKNTLCHLRGLDSNSSISQLSTKRRSNFRSMVQLPPPKVSAEHEALAQIILSPDTNQTKEGLRDFIDQKREIFLAQLAIETKKEELFRLERLEQEEKDNLQKKEQEIDLFKEQFRSFLENDNKITEEKYQEAKNKESMRTKVSDEIKRISSENSNLRNDIALYEEKYKECEEYREFLEELTPYHWRQTHPLPELYYKQPEQLVEILTHLENQNMFLIRHCQEAEEAVERIKAKFNEMLEERDSSLTEMTSKKDVHDKYLDELNERNEQYNYSGTFHHFNQIPQNELNELIDAITDFHNKLGFDAAATGDAATMLKRIEGKMEELDRILSTVDQKVVKDLSQEKAHKRRDQERAEKAAKKQHEQEEKTLKALQLATMPINKRTGRPFYERSCPLKTESREKREEKMRLEQAQREADLDLLFGPIWD